MKKLHTLMAAVAVSALAIGQNASTNLESFEALEGALPACWASLDADDDEVNWEIIETPETWPVHSGAGCAVSSSWNGAPLTPDNYLILPQLDIQAGEHLSFWVAAQDPDYAAEQYSVVLSTTGVAAADFSVSLSNETLASNEYEERTVDLTEYAGQTVYIAFRHHDVSDMFYIKIDDVLYPTTVEECVITVDVEDVEDVTTAINIYPNPTTDLINITGTQAELVEVYNQLGQIVIREQIMAGSGVVTVDVRDLSNGVYTVSVQSATGTVQEQIVKH